MHVETDGRGGLAAARSLHPVAIVLDVGLPGMDGTEVCRRLRADGDWTPVLFVTARDDEIDRVLGLELGADDYVTKPFSPREIVARVRSVLRRTSGSVPADRPLAVGSRGSRPGATPGGWPTAPRSCSRRRSSTCSRTCCAGPGRVYPREQLLSEVWGYAAAAGTRTVDVHIAQLRVEARHSQPDPDRARASAMPPRREPSGSSLSRSRGVTADSPRRWSLTGQTALVTTAVALVAVVITGVVSLGLVRDATEEQARRTLGDQADLVAATLDRREALIERAARRVPPQLRTLLSAQEIGLEVVTPEAAGAAGLSGDRGGRDRGGQPGVVPGDDGRRRHRSSRLGGPRQVASSC